MKEWMFAMAVGLVGSALHAEGVSIDLLPPPSSEESVVTRDVFGGSTRVIRLAVDAPLGAKARVTGDLFQLGGSLAVPLGSCLPNGEALMFTDRTHRVVDAPISLPEVSRVTRMQARFQAQCDTGSSNVLQVPLLVYPKDFLASFREGVLAAQSRGGAKLVVLGKSPAIREFFRSQKVSFEDGGAEPLTDPQAGSVYFLQGSADEIARKIPDASRGRFVLFVEDSPLLAGVYSSDSGRFLKVTLSILKELTTNPRNQRTFAAIVERSLGLATSEIP
jgi:hypothetical protein